MSGRLLCVFPSVLSMTSRGLEIDSDLAEGVRLYMENFDELRLASPVVANLADSGLRRTTPVDSLPHHQRMKFFVLPDGYHPMNHFSYRSQVRTILRTEIEKADYLIFSPHALFGDWPTIALQEAVKLKRRYVIEADVVYESVAMTGRGKAWKKRLQQYVMNPLFQKAHRYGLQNSSLALLQGQDVFDAYAPFCNNPHKVHHLSISKKDFISADDLSNKLGSVSKDRPLKICYAGRAIDMKGPMDWLNTISTLIKDGASIKATWLGDGSMLTDMVSSAKALGIADHVKFPGYIGDRDEILRTLRNSDLLLFTHKTRESARIFGEALVSGCPIVGYWSAYPEELTRERGGGLFVPVGDWTALAKTVLGLAQNPDALIELIKDASLSGRLYDRDAAMQRRIDLVKQYMGEKQLADRPGAPAKN
jgi:glycosyltransferase involved in cell wall biosynthesis